MFSAAVTADERAVSRSVIAATNCLVSPSLGLFADNCRSEFSAPAILADSLPPWPEN